MDPLVSQVPRVMVRDALNLLHQPIGRRRFSSAVSEQGGKAKVAIGCSHIRIQGWICTDISFRAQAYLDLTHPWPAPPGAVSRVYGDSVIEHFPLVMGRSVLKHTLAALSPGGRIRLVTPDVERTARAYLHDPELTTLHLERHRRHGYTADHPVDLLRVTFAECGHHLGYCFDFDTLATELTDAGFTNVIRSEAGESDDPEFAGLDQRVGPTERLTALVVEAEKPG